MDAKLDPSLPKGSWRIRRRRVWAGTYSSARQGALHFLPKPESSAILQPHHTSNPGLVEIITSPLRSCHTTLANASSKSTRLPQPHCLWTCSLLCQECLFSVLLPSRSNLRDVSSREACLPLPERIPCPLLHVLTEL